MDQGLILSFKYYFFKKYICEAIAAIDTNASDESGQSKMKSLWKGFIIQMPLRMFSNSQKEVKLITLTGRS